MFSNFGNIFITRPRHAETSDTRLGIRRHDPDQESRRKKQEEESATAMFDTEDNATVTVEALRIFLEHFLKTFAAQNSENNSPPIAVQTPRKTPETAPDNRPLDGETAKAVGAYKHVAQKTSAAPSMPDVSESPTAPAGPSLEAAEIRTIYKLLEDLKPLATRGIEYLTIERSESFLTSLVNAVEKSKTFYK